jgi:DUF1365 family protein
MFRYRLFMMYLDLAETADVFRGRWLWGCERRTLAMFRQSDHLGNPAQSLDHAVRDVVETAGYARPQGPIRLLTQLRYFGYLMNPVSYFYCFDCKEQLECVVAEVNNTPWGERHCYVVSAEQCKGGGPTTEKEFHVSPFMPMDRRYRWRLSNPGKDLTKRVVPHAMRTTRRAGGYLTLPCD